MKTLELHKCTCGYGKKVILPQVSMHIEQGELYLIEGENGSGKTTLGLTLLGLLPLLHGKRICTFHNCAYVPQKSQLDYQYPIKIRTLVSMGLQSFASFNIIAALKQRKKNSQKLKNLLNRLNLYEKQHLRFSETSGGELQRALIARAFISEPDVILLDEPFANIDKKGRDLIKEILLQEHKENNTTLIVIDHHSNLDFYTKKIILTEGEVEINGSL